MKNKKLLAIILLSLSLCFVSGAGYGEVPQWLLETKASQIQVTLLSARIDYMMRNPASYLDVTFAHSVETGEIFVVIHDNRDRFPYKSEVALLDTFKRELETIYSFIAHIATNINADVMVAFFSRGNIQLGSFRYGEYYLLDEAVSKEAIRTDESAKETERAPTSLKFGGQTYTGAAKGHWISEKIDGGRIIKLEDGSLWEISSLDRIDTMLWLVTESITVIGSTNPFYPYYLLNTSTEDLVEAKLISS